MTFNQFIKKYISKYVDFDGWYGAQCVDLAQLYNRDVIGSKTRFTGNAVDIFGQQPKVYKWIKNTPTGVPQPGDIMIWKSSLNGGPGHVSIVTKANVVWFDSFDQNFPLNSASHIQRHSYRHVLGWGRPVKNIPKPAPKPKKPSTTKSFTVRVNKPAASVRSAPRLSAPLSGSRLLFYGQTFTATAKVKGTPVSGNDIWFKSSLGNYVWSGGLKIIN